jgi:CRP-like cAMP-binding protein
MQPNSMNGDNSAGFEPGGQDLARAPIFAAVAPADLAALLARSHAAAFDDGVQIFSRGDAALSVYLVIDGLVRIGTLSENGKRVTVEILDRFQLFGELGVVDQQARTADAIAMGMVKVMIIPAEAFRDLLRTSPAFALALVRLVTQRLRRTYALFEDASLADLEHRLARQVLYLVGLGATEGRRVRLYSRLRQQDLADLLGATSRSIITILNKWRSEGLVAFDGRTAQLTVLDMPRFAALAQEDTTAT